MSSKEELDRRVSEEARRVVMVAAEYRKKWVLEVGFERDTEEAIRPLVERILELEGSLSAPVHTAMRPTRDELGCDFTETTPQAARRVVSERDTARAELAHEIECRKRADQLVQAQQVRIDMLERQLGRDAEQGHAIEVLKEQAQIESDGHSEVQARHEREMAAVLANLALEREGRRRAEVRAGLYEHMALRMAADDKKLGLS